MKVLQATCIAGLIAFTGFYLAGGNRPVTTVPDALPEAATNALAPALYAQASAKLAEALRAASRPLMAAAEITDYAIGPKLASLGHQDIAQPLPTARDASDDAPKMTSSAQDFRYLI
jgi:pectin methylesterase-like acyl-CoA thioesterase